MNRPLNLSDSISPANKDLMIISHRGEWATAPENSIDAMLLAADAGADMVEIDVQKTMQGQLYLMHDDTTDRMSNRSGNTIEVKEHEFETLFLRDQAGGRNAKITDSRVPTLGAALEAARGRIHLNIDTKHRRDLEAVGQLVFEMEMQDQVLIKMVIDPTDPDMSILDSSWYQSLTFMPVLLDPKPGRMSTDAIKVAQLFDAKILEISFFSLDDLLETSEQTRKRGIRLWVNTLNAVHPLDLSDERALENPDEVWGTLMRSGIGAIQTDQTPSLSEFIGRSIKND